MSGLALTGGGDGAPRMLSVLGVEFALPADVPLWAIRRGSWMRATLAAGEEDEVTAWLSDRAHAESFLAAWIGREALAYMLRANVDPRIDADEVQEIVGQLIAWHPATVPPAVA